jgi:hypothetical protein
MATQKPWLIVEPAYWRVYLTNEAMRKDWDEGKDFRIENFGPYMSRRDLDNNTMDIKTEYAGVQIVQRREHKESTVPYLTEEITW